MSKKEDAAFAEWLGEVVGEFPEEQRDAAKTLLSNDIAREQFYRGTLRSDEFYRRLNEIEAAKQELESARTELSTWYEDEEPKLAALTAERDNLREQLEKVGSGGPPPAAGIPGFTSEKLADLVAKAEKIELLDKITPAIMADVSAVLYDAIKNNYDIDPREIMRQSLQNGVEPYKAYEFLTQDQRKKRFETAEEDKKKKWIEEGRRQAISAKQGSPDQLPNQGPTVFDILTKKDSPDSTQSTRVDAAMKEFYENGISGLGS